MKIFICFTPFQLYYAECIILNFFDKKDENILLIYSQGNLRGYNFKCEVETLKLRSVGNFSFLINHSKAKKKILNLVEHKNHLEIFVSHTGSLLTNFIFHNKLINRNAKINLFYEGLLSLNDYSEKFNSQHLKRIVGGLMVGILYKYNKTIYPYKNDRIHKIYTPLPELTLGERSKKISCAIRLKEHQNNKTNRCLILGGPIENILEYYKVFLKEIAEKSFSEIVYKGHPAFNTYRKDEKHTFRNLAAQHNVDFVEIHEDEIIEDVISKYPSKVIYSYPSSALINLKLIIDDSCEIKCYLHKDLVLDQNLHRIYKTINIKINPIY